MEKRTIESLKSEMINDAHGTNATITRADYEKMNMRQLLAFTHPLNRAKYIAEINLIRNQ